MVTYVEKFYEYLEQGKMRPCSPRFHNSITVYCNKHKWILFCWSKSKQRQKESIFKDCVNDNKYETINGRFKVSLDSISKEKYEAFMHLIAQAKVLNLYWSTDPDGDGLDTMYLEMER